MITLYEFTETLEDAADELNDAYNKLKEAFDEIANSFIEVTIKMKELDEALYKLYREENPLPRPSNKLYFKRKGYEYIKSFKRNLPYQRRDYWRMVS